MTVRMPPTTSMARIRIVNSKLNCDGPIEPERLHAQDAAQRDDCAADDERDQPRGEHLDAHRAGAPVRPREWRRPIGRSCSTGRTRRRATASTAPNSAHPSRAEPRHAAAGSGATGEIAPVLGHLTHDEQERQRDHRGREARGARSDQAQTAPTRRPPTPGRETGDERAELDVGDAPRRIGDEHAPCVLAGIAEQRHHVGADAGETEVAERQHAGVADEHLEADAR